MSDAQLAHPAAQIIKPATGDTGPTYSYRSSIIGSNAGGTIFSFTLDGFPGGWWSGPGDIEAIVRVIDSWLDTGRLATPHVKKGTGVAG